MAYRIKNRLSQEQENFETDLITERMKSVVQKTGDLAPSMQTGKGMVQVVQNITYNITVNQTASDTLSYETPYQQASVFTKEATTAKLLLELLLEMGKNLNEPLGFEQARAAFLSTLRDLEERKQTRELYFTDLVIMIDVGLSYTDSSGLTEESIGVLREAVTGLPRKLTAEDLKYFRKRFREASIDILRPLRAPVDVAQLIKELFA
jgi:hypothetical protein